MEPHVVHFEIEGLDGPALRRFYSALFGWEFRTDSSFDYGLLAPAGRERRIDGVLGGAVSSVPEDPSSTWRGPSRAEGYRGHVTVYVEVPDLEAALVRAESLGGRRMQGPDPLPDGLWTGKFVDPEGHLVGLVTAPR